MSRDISNSDDVIDSRDVIERIKELREEEERLTDAVRDVEELIEEQGENASTTQQLADARRELDEWYAGDEGIELKALVELEEEASGSADWRYGATLIRDSYFEDYARELAADIGAIDPHASWPLNCIDWEKAAEQLQMDYTSVEFGGVTYWVR